MPQPDAGSCELEEGKVVSGALFVSRGDSAVVFEFVEEAFDQVPVAIQEPAEYRRVKPVVHRPDIAHTPWAAIVSRRALLS
jgi:hypothetical protein